MHITTHYSNAIQMDFWQDTLASPQDLLWGFSNLSFPTQAVVNLQDHFARGIESNELHLLQTLQLNPEIKWVGVPTPFAFLPVDYF
ncbi:MAG: hypothetical protein RL650_362 [Pseudomonadota bacterium]